MGGADDGGLPLCAVLQRVVLGIVLPAGIGWCVLSLPSSGVAEGGRLGTTRRADAAQRLLPVRAAGGDGRAAVVAAHACRRTTCVGCRVTTTAIDFSDDGERSSSRDWNDGLISVRMDAVR